MEIGTERADGGADLVFGGFDGEGEDGEGVSAGIDALTLS
jgi:hypothetical protein